MTNQHSFCGKHNRPTLVNALGFTTIELVVVIILLGVLAVTAMPRLISQQSILSSQYQTQLLSALRLAQWQQMNRMQANNPCLMLSLNASTLAPLNSCAAPPEGVTVAIPSAEQAMVSFSGPSTIQFTTEGLPSGGCSGGCTLTITDTQRSRQVEINAEGYIYAP